MSTGVTVDTLTSGTIRVTNAAPGHWRSDRHLVERFRIAGPDASTGFARITGLAIGADDRLWVLDDLHKKIFVFDARGTPIMTVGREGEGPGEIRSGVGLFVGGQGQVWLSDAGNQRYTAFGADGEVAVERRRRIVGRPRVWRQRNIRHGGFIESGVGVWGNIAMNTAFSLDEDFAKIDSLPVSLTPEQQEPTLFEFPNGGFAFVPWSTQRFWAPAWLRTALCVGPTDLRRGHNYRPSDGRRGTNRFPGRA